jgi:hypothetical protein
MRMKKRRSKSRRRIKRSGPKNRRISKSNVRLTFDRTTQPHSHTRTLGKQCYDLHSTAITNKHSLSTLT